jgi:hypothetical protein
MALNYDYSHLMTGMSQRLGSFWVYMKFDVEEIRKGAFPEVAGIPSGTDFKIGKLKGGTQIRDSFIRVLTASTGSATYEIGVVEGGTLMDTGLDSATAGDWVQGDIDPLAPASGSSLAKATEDHYIWLQISTAAIADGVLEIMLECVAGADDNY